MQCKTFVMAAVGLCATHAATHAANPTQAVGTCSAQSAAQPPQVVELYTSQGCSSCPPADRWLSTLKGRSDVLALSFHVNYWNHLGWPDPFATAATTERQHQWRKLHGGSYVYTPQIVLNGADMRDWSGLRAGNWPPQPRLQGGESITVKLDAQHNTLRATVAAARAGQRLAGYWAVLEDAVSQRVKAGENAGSTLAHDHVVVYYAPVAAWAASATPQVLSLQLPANVALNASRRAVLVVTQADGLRPLQAAVLRCG
jgi:hypothetical protein